MGFGVVGLKWVSTQIVVVPARAKKAHCAQTKSRRVVIKTYFSVIARKEQSTNMLITLGLVSFPCTDSRKVAKCGQDTKKHRGAYGITTTTAAFAA